MLFKFRIIILKNMDHAYLILSLKKVEVSLVKLSRIILVVLGV